jgi:hypothetical protein
MSLLTVSDRVKSAYSALRLFDYHNLSYGYSDKTCCAMSLWKIESCVFPWIFSSIEMLTSISQIKAAFSIDKAIVPLIFVFIQVLNIIKS